MIKVINEKQPDSSRVEIQSVSIPVKSRIPVRKYSMA